MSIDLRILDAIGDRLAAETAKDDRMHRAEAAQASMATAASGTIGI